MNRKDEVARKVKEEYRNQLIQGIIRIIAQEFGVRESLYLSRSRKTNIVAYRHTCIYMIKEFTSLKLVQIGRYFNVHHSSVISTIRSMENHLETEADTKSMIQHIRKRIKLFLRDFTESKEFESDFMFIDMDDIKSVQVAPSKYILAVGMSSDELSSYFKTKPKIIKHKNTGLFLLESKPQKNDNQITNKQKEDETREEQNQVE